MTGSLRRSAVITGASRGIGAGVAVRLAEVGYDLVLTARESSEARRSEARVREAALAGARTAWVSADLSRLTEVRRLADEIRGAIGAPTLLVHCAAVVPSSEIRTPDGFETQWAVNHLAPFLLTALVGPEPGGDGEPGRVVTVASKLHRGGGLTPSATLFSDGPYDRERRYRDTKLANVLFARALARRCDPSRRVSLSLHPGAAGTGLFHDLQGTGTLDRLVNRAIRTARRAEPWGLADCIDRVSDVCTRTLTAADHGSYREDGEIVDPSPAASDDELGEWLWHATEQAVAS
jgi:NAD(P)-dependent dehydrogenase (short-subunit alcohol dehydrogenase family)